MAKAVSQQTTVMIAMKELYQSEASAAQLVPIKCGQDHIIALVLNEAGEAMVWERQKPDGGAYWEMMERQIKPDEDPFSAVQQALLTQTGRQTCEWAFLGSHVTDISQPSGVDYFFCARQACKVVSTAQAQQAPDGELLQRRWVSITDLRYALLDGRLAMTRHALTVSLALLTILK